MEVGGKRVKGRVYPWGVVEVENPAHSDFARLRQFLVRCGDGGGFGVSGVFLGGLVGWC